jgi:hypothetical protein
MRSIQKILPVAQGTFCILINGHDHCLDVVVTPALAGRQVPHFGEGTCQLRPSRTRLGAGWNCFLYTEDVGGRSRHRLPPFGTNPAAIAWQARPDAKLFPCWASEKTNGTGTPVLGPFFDQLCVNRMLTMPTRAILSNVQTPPRCYPKRRKRGTLPPPNETQSRPCISRGGFSLSPRIERTRGLQGGADSPPAQEKRVAFPRAKQGSRDDSCPLGCPPTPPAPTGTETGAPNDQSRHRRQTLRGHDGRRAATVPLQARGYGRPQRPGGLQGT